MYCYKENKLNKLFPLEEKYNKIQIHRMLFITSNTNSSNTKMNYFNNRFGLQTVELFLYVLSTTADWQILMNEI